MNKVRDKVSEQELQRVRNLANQEVCKLKVDNKVQLDINTAMASYISKSKTVLGIAYDEQPIKMENKILPFTLKIVDTTIACTFYSFLDI